MVGLNCLLPDLSILKVIYNLAVRNLVVERVNVIEKEGNVKITVRPDKIGVMVKRFKAKRRINNDFHSVRGDIRIGNNNISGGRVLLESLKEERIGKRGENKIFREMKDMTVRLKDNPEHFV